MVFTRAQCRGIQAGRITGTLVPASERVRAGRVRVLRRRADENGDPPPRRIETVCDTLPGGERVAVLITIILVRDLEPAELTVVEARVCGFRTSTELRAAWCSEHPRLDAAKLVRFALGDTRDVPLLLARTGSGSDYTHDPSRAMFAEPEPVSPGDQTRFAVDAQQRYLRLQADRARDLASRSISERLAAIEQSARR